MKSHILDKLRDKKIFFLFFIIFGVFFKDMCFANEAPPTFWMCFRDDKNGQNIYFETRTGLSAVKKIYEGHFDGHAKKTIDILLRLDFFTKRSYKKTESIVASGEHFKFFSAQDLDYYINREKRHLEDLEISMIYYKPSHNPLLLIRQFSRGDKTDGNNNFFYDLEKGGSEMTFHYQKEDVVVLNPAPPFAKQINPPL